MERSIGSQLWKISFSALIYGVLVLSCLGGVVWGMAFVFGGLFPIHWSSTEPVLEFPVDLLFYNFLMPLAVKFFRPSEGLTKIYGWWFRKCARALRLTNFLFGETIPDEQGRHVRRSWSSWLQGKKGDIAQPVIGKDREVLMDDGEVDVYFLRDGKFVDAPASDQVRVHKSRPTYIEVPEDYEKYKQLKESQEYQALERTPGHFTRVYIPPHFRLRTFAFAFLVWLFAAITGISTTVIPLQLGRFIFSKFMPDHVRMNDIYSFAIGAYILGGALYLALNIHRIITFFRAHLTPHSTTINSILQKSCHLTIRFLGLLYTYSALTILLPALISLTIQCYLIIPLHTYLSTHTPATSTTTAITQSPTAPTTSTLDPTTTHPEPTIPRPIIHLVQDWTLGLLYLKVIVRLILWSAPSRPATALRAIIRAGWLNPDIRLATRGFILPATVFFATILLTPLAVGWVAIHTVSTSGGDHLVITETERVYRYAYPAMMAATVAMGVAWATGKAFGRWRKRVRDEVYLIGERLHNYGEVRRRRGSVPAAGGNVDRKGKGRERVERPLLGDGAVVDDGVAGPVE